MATDQLVQATASRVEVSGWDIDEEFFVENAELHQDLETERRIRLRHPLRKGAVIFVRLLHKSGCERQCPRAYEVDPLAVDERGLCEYRLNSLRTRSRVRAGASPRPPR